MLGGGLAVACCSKMHETVGPGSYGKVKRCIDTTDGHTYAAKVVNKSILKRKRVGRFGTALDGVKKELSIWKKLNHENVVNLVEVIDDPGGQAAPERGVPCTPCVVCICIRCSAGAAGWPRRLRLAGRSRSSAARW